MAQKPLVQAYVMDQIFDKMANNEAALAPYYSGDGIVMLEENDKLDYFVPEEGANRFVDAMCVPKDSPHKTEAEQYINFLCSTEVAKANAEYIGYSTPQTEARKQLDPEIGENPDFYPPEEVLSKTEVFITLQMCIRASIPCSASSSRLPASTSRFSARARTPRPGTI